MKLAYFAEAALRLLFPSECPICHVPLEMEENSLCVPCQGVLAARKPASLTCVEPKLPFIDKAWHLYPYEAPVRNLLTGIKFQRMTWLVNAFDRDIQPLRGSMPQIDLVIPIPLDRIKHVQREFNQSTLFAKKIAAVLQAPLRSGLKKIRATAPQHGLDRGERNVNLSGVFKVSRPADIQNKTILLVDDVVTTGATAREAARALKAQGAAKVFLLAIARTELS